MSLNLFQSRNISPTGSFINNLPVLYENGTTALMSGGSCTCQDLVGRQFNIFIRDTLSFNTEILGAGGLDSYLVAAQKALIGLYVIADSSGARPPALLGQALTVGTSLLTNSPVPFLPSGYDSYILRYYIHLDDSLSIVPFVMVGSGANYSNIFNNAIQMLNNGSSSTTSILNLLPYVPAQRAQLFLRAQFNSAGAGASLYLSAGDNITIQNVPARTSAVVGASLECIDQIFTGYEQGSDTYSIRYRVSAGSTTSLYLSGYSVGLI